MAKETYWVETKGGRFKLSEESLPDFHAPVERRDGVEVSYGSTRGGIWKKIVDRSDDSVSYHFVSWAKAPKEHGIHSNYWERSPNVRATSWRRVEARRSDATKRRLMR